MISEKLILEEANYFSLAEIKVELEGMGLLRAQAIEFLIRAFRSGGVG